MSIFIHELEKWPAIAWDNGLIIARLASVRHNQGRLQGKWEALGCPLPKPAGDALTRDATQHPDQPLTQAMLLHWHTTLFLTGLSGDYPIRTGAWRDDAGGPLQLVSTQAGVEHIHYEAPAAARLDAEVSTFLDWFNHDTDTDPVLKAAVAHFWFATLSPFDDGNGRIARAITDRQLALAEGMPHRLYDLAAIIAADQHAYFHILEQSQKGDLNITAWILWFLERLDHAITQAEENLSTQHSDLEIRRALHFNERQRIMLDKLKVGFEGNLTSTRWAEFVQCSPDTALRDIHDLMDKGILEKEESGGRSTRYRMKH